MQLTFKEAFILGVGLSAGFMAFNKAVQLFTILAQM